MDSEDLVCRLFFGWCLVSVSIKSTLALERYCGNGQKASLQTIFCHSSKKVALHSVCAFQFQLPPPCVSTPQTTWNPAPTLDFEFRFAQNLSLHGYQKTHEQDTSFSEIFNAIISYQNTTGSVLIYLKTPDIVWS